MAVCPVHPTSGQYIFSAGHTGPLAAIMGGLGGAGAARVEWVTGATRRDVTDHHHKP